MITFILLIYIHENMLIVIANQYALQLSFSENYNVPVNAVFLFLNSDREIRFKCFLQNTIIDVLRARPGWQEVQG